MVNPTQHALEELRAKLAAAHEGSIDVNDALVELRFDSDGREYAQVTLIVSDPPPGQETWSLDDAFALRQRVRRAAADVGLFLDVGITITSTGDAGTADNDGDGGALDDEAAQEEE